MATSLFVNSPSRTAIRPINTTRDMPKVLRLLNQVFSPTLDAEGRRALNRMGNQPPFAIRLNRLGQKFAAGYVYEVDGQIIGNVSIIPTTVNGRVIIANVAVHDEYRRNGIANQLMEAALDHLQHRAVRHVLLQVDVDNHGALQLYHNLHFKTIGTTTFWTANPGSWREIASPSDVPIRPLQGKEFRDAYNLDLQTYPIDLNWPDPININTYRQGFLKVIDQFFNGKSSESWAVASNGNLLALGSIWTEWGQANRLSLRVDEKYQDELLAPLFAKLLRRLRFMRRRSVVIEHQMDDPLAKDMLLSANFYAKRHLTTMKLNFVD